MSAILDKIKKLFDKAESAKELGNLHEAEAFMNKVQELMNEHRVSMMDLANHSTDPDKFAKWIYSEPINYFIKQPGTNVWRIELMAMICRFNMTKMVYQTGRKTMHVMGRIEDVEVSIWLYNFLSTALFRMAVEGYNEIPKAQRIAENLTKHQFIRNFITGAIIGVHKQLDEKQNTSQYKNQILELMVVNKNMIMEFQNKFVGRVKPVSGPNLKQGTGTIDGFAAGSNINLDGRRLGNESAAQRRLLK